MQDMWSLMLHHLTSRSGPHSGPAAVWKRCPLLCQLAPGHRARARRTRGSGRETPEPDIPAGRKQVTPRLSLFGPGKPSSLLHVEPLGIMQAKFDVEGMGQRRRIWRGLRLFNVAAAAGAPPASLSACSTG